MDLGGIPRDFNRFGQIEERVTMRRLTGEYRRLVSALERLGVAAYVNDRGQLIVAEAVPPLPSKNSFWLRYKPPHWHLITWAPRVYRLPGDAIVEAVCVACLRASASAIASLPKELMNRYSLEELGGDDAEALMS
jgi:hypothetical protein